MLADDMKRYVRKYGNAKEGEFFKKSDEYCGGRFRKLMNAQGRKIYYPYTHEICDYDAQGFPILGYPGSFFYFLCCFWISLFNPLFFLVFKKIAYIG